MPASNAANARKAARQVQSGRAGDIRDVALTLFAERGYLGTSMRDIASELGLRAPSLYNHLDSKQELLRDIMLRTMKDLGYHKGYKLYDKDSYLPDKLKNKKYLKGE